VTRWLDPVRQALDAGATPVRVFVRDDDVGWADQRLFALLDLCAELGVPIDLAVIPCALTEPLTARLGRWPAEVHQHGYAHVNHQPSGRKCEFGPARSPTAQLRDIAHGWQRLRALLGPAVRPIFTPPWNRCGDETAAGLAELGFAALSRDLSAGTVDLPGLTELPITFDWFARRNGVPLSREQRGVLLAGQIDLPRPIGIMLHHALFDGEELAALRDLFEVLAPHPRVRLANMAAFYG